MRDNTPLNIDEVRTSLQLVHGHRIADLGEDGERFLIEGHVSAEDLLPVINAYIEREWAGDPIESVDNLPAEHVWMCFTRHQDGCDDGVCEPCRAGHHDDCTNDATTEQFCDCEDVDHVGTWCSCEEYAWWAEPWPASTRGPFPATGHQGYYAMTVVDL